MVPISPRETKAIRFRIEARSAGERLVSTAIDQLLGRVRSPSPSLPGIAIIAPSRMTGISPSATERHSNGWNRSLQPGTLGFSVECYAHVF
jgi:hypothetical protein